MHAIHTRGILRSISREPHALRTEVSRYGLRKPVTLRVAATVLLLTGLAAALGGCQAPPAVDDGKPHLISAYPPMYPMTARRQNLEGKVVVEWVVAEDGQVRDARVISSTDPIFEAPALHAVRKMKFAPARQNGHPVAFRLRTEVNFSLRDQRFSPGSFSEPL